MKWYDEAIFYHIYPLGLTGAPKENSYGEVEHRLNTLLPWIEHIKEIGCNALYIGPLFESVGHGYETTDYKKLDSRLGTNKDLTDFVSKCHKQGIRVILDGVFNHTGRDFFAFQDIKKNRENSPYKDWYCGVNFWGNNQYNDGFSYENWGGYDLLVKLNQHNPAVKDYICDVIRFWVKEFDIDGIRLDAADVLDFGYMQALRHTANEVKPDFWLMGEVIHGDYTRWVNEGTLHSVTNYHLHKALYSGHNDHNYFEIAHTVKRLYGMGGNRPDGLKLYNFVDNHDVERIYTKLNNKAHFSPVHVLLYTLPGIPSIYYGSEFGIEGKKERFSDDSLRPALSFSDYKEALKENSCTRLIASLGKVRQEVKALSYGDYKELVLTNRQYAFSRSYDGETILVAVNNDDNDSYLRLQAGEAAEYMDMLSGETIPVQDGHIDVKMSANSGQIWVPIHENSQKPQPVVSTVSAGNEEKESKEGQKVDKEEIIENKKTARKRSAAKKVADKEITGKTIIEKETTDEEAAEKEKSVPAKKSKNKKAAAKGISVKEQKIVQPQERKEDKLLKTQKTAEEKASTKEKADKSYEEMDISELQEAILEKMSKNGPITDQMRRDVMENVYHNSLINWVKSFH